MKDQIILKIDKAVKTKLEIRARLVDRSLSSYVRQLIFNDLANAKQ